MEITEFVPIKELCRHYQLDIVFFERLQEVGLIEIISVKETRCVHPDKIRDLEKMIRIHHELNVNIEGVDVIFNLLKRMEQLKKELNDVKNKLRLYE